MPYNPTTARLEADANARFQAERTGEPDALPDPARRALVAAFFARNRAACDYANQLAADPNSLAIEAEANRNETGNAHFTR